MGGKISLCSFNWICHGQLGMGFSFILSYNPRCSDVIQNLLLDSADGDNSLIGNTSTECSLAHNELRQIYQHGMAEKLDCGIYQLLHIVMSETMPQKISITDFVQCSAITSLVEKSSAQVSEAGNTPPPAVHLHRPLR